MRGLGGLVSAPTPTFAVDTGFLAVAVAVFSTIERSRRRAREDLKSNSTIIMSASALPVPPTPPSPTHPQTAEARAAFTASLLSAGTSTVESDLKSRAGDLHANTATIDKQEQALLKETKNLGREGDKWQKVVDDGARGVKETGDVQNWAEMLERDLCVLEDTMAMVDEEAGNVNQAGSHGLANGHR